MAEQKTPNENSTNCTRRKFLKVASAGSVVVGSMGLVALKGAGSLAYAGTEGGIAPAAYQLNFDEKLCAGCNLCETACSTFHEGYVSPAAARNDFVLKPIVEFLGMSALSANAEGYPQPLARAMFAEFSENHFCKQCPAPECLQACPEQAISVDPKTGARVVDEKKCVGCGTCAEACQFNMIRVNPISETAVKCDFCGGNPQCVAWCPTGAITWQKV